MCKRWTLAVSFVIAHHRQDLWSWMVTSSDSIMVSYGCVLKMGDLHSSHIIAILMREKRYGEMGSSMENFEKHPLFFTLSWPKEVGKIILVLYFRDISGIYPAIKLSMFDYIINYTAGWWFGTWILFSILYGIIHPIDSYFSRWLKPPTRQDYACSMVIWGSFWTTKTGTVCPGALQTLLAVNVQIPTEVTTAPTTSKMQDPVGPVRLKDDCWMTVGRLIWSGKKKGVKYCEMLRCTLLKMPCHGFEYITYIYIYIL